MIYHKPSIFSYLTLLRTFSDVPALHQELFNGTDKVLLKDFHVLKKMSSEPFMLAFPLDFAISETLARPPALLGAINDGVVI